MKKTFISVVFVLALLMCFVSCGSKNDNKPNLEQGIGETNKNTYEILNELANTNYKKVELDITSVTDGIELKSNYILTDSIVAYSVEQLNMLPTDGNITNISPEYKTTFTGTAIIEDGKVTRIDNEAVTLPSYDELQGGFYFNENNFKNISIGTNRFTADIISPAEFLGTNKTIKNMTIIVDYDFNAFQKITITYQTSNSEIKLVYKFDK